MIAYVILMDIWLCFDVNIKAFSIDGIITELNQQKRYWTI